MGQRATRRAGILKTRVEDPQAQRILDGVIERVEVLDGLRGDVLDKAVTYRDLGLSGFTIRAGAGGTGTPQIINTPGPGDGSADGPGIGAAAAPTNLAVAETFLALLLTWDNPNFNLQHIEVWRATVDNLSLAVFIGTTVSPQFVDYVGASATFYYWVRAVGTDGTFSSFNAVAGTLGTTGIDPSDFEINISVSTSNLDAALAARIDLVDFPATGLVDRLAIAEGDIVASDANITTLQSDVSGLNTTVGGHTTSIDGNATSISTNQTNITTLQTDVTNAQGDIITNTTAITVNASDILNLEATIGALDAEGGQTWEFLTDLEGFTTVRASAVHTGVDTGALIFTPSDADPQLLSNTISVSGGIFTQVVMRVKQTVGGGTWEGSCLYETSGHSISGSFIKSIPDPSLSLSQWKTLTWDMTALDAGGDDWINSVITKLRFDLVSDNAAKFEIDWIIIAKFSTQAVSEAISALDVRVTANESGISGNATAITALEVTVDDATDGVTANANAITALTADVVSNDGDISANAASILALQVTVDDPTTGVAVNASAIDTLQVDVSNNQGSLTAQATSITQLTASVNGGFASLVNPLQTLNEGFGTSYIDADVQTINDIGGRFVSLVDGVAAVRTTAANVTDTVFRLDGTRLRIDARGVYEVKVSLYHNRPTNAGTFLFGFETYADLTGGAAQVATAINDGVLGSGTTSPTWLSGENTTGDNEWQDITCYILGPEASPLLCPDLVVNGSKDNTVLLYQVFNDGFQVSAANPFVELKLKNFNASPTFGDDTSTTLYATDLQVRRVDSFADSFAALQVESTVRASDIGDLNALYAVKVELSTGGDPYITGFGLAADVIDGVASSSFGIRADQFFITSPSFGTVPGGGPGTNANSSFPFIVDLVDGVATVAIDGQLVVDGTIRADSIIAKSIGTREVNVEEINVELANIGILTGGLIRTAPSPAFRIELEDTASTIYPLWYGAGAKGESGRFFVRDDGTVVVRGLLDAGMIAQSFFTPADANSSFRIAVDYPSNYTAGVYTGKSAHINPVLTTGFNAAEGSFGPLIIVNAPDSQHEVGYHTDAIRLLSPTHSSSTQYGRLGTLSENLLISYSTTLHNEFSDQQFWLILKYKYDAEVERQAHIYFSKASRGGRQTTIVAEDIFITRETPWSTLDIRLGVGAHFIDAGPDRGTVGTINLTVSTANFGYADLGSIVNTVGATSGSTVIDRDASITRRYL